LLPRSGCRRGRATPVGAEVKGACALGSCVAGFTLIEVLVVLVLIGIIISFAVLKVGGDQRADELNRAARTFAAVLELASDVAISRSEEWGVRVDAEGYRFVVLGQDKQDGKRDKAAQNKWIDVENDPVFRARAWDRGMRVELELEGRDALLEDADKEEDKPSILLLSSGEMTPFVATFSARETKARAQVEGDGLGNVKTAMLDEF
jgi:general secretion pathway protein H